MHTYFFIVLEWKTGQTTTLGPYLELETAIKLCKDHPFALTGEWARIDSVSIHECLLVTPPYQWKDIGRQITFDAQAIVPPGE